MSSFRVRIGPAIFDIRSPFRRLVRQVRSFYRDYPQDFSNEIYDFAVEGRPTSMVRRFLRPSLSFNGDYTLDEIVPVEHRLGLLGFEMAINLQMALGYLRHSVIHAASAARGEEAVLITGESGSGKSTLSALLSYSSGWRHLGDELALLSLAEPLQLHPYPRPIGLKNESIAEMEARAPSCRFGPLLTDTLKGDVRHLLPPKAAIEAQLVPARPRLVISPRFQKGVEPAARRMTESECYVRLSTASTNQPRLGEAGFNSLVQLVRTVPGYDIVYGSSEQGVALVEDLWSAT